jgi:hypothetical protein
MQALVAIVAAPYSPTVGQGAPALLTSAIVVDLALPSRRSSVLANSLVFLVKGTPLLSLWAAGMGIMAAGTLGAASRAARRRQNRPGPLALMGMSALQAATCFAVLALRK